MSAMPTVSRLPKPRPSPTRYVNGSYHCGGPAPSGRNGLTQPVGDKKPTGRRCGLPQPVTSSPTPKTGFRPVGLPPRGRGLSLRSPQVLTPLHKKPSNQLTDLNRPASSSCPPRPRGTALPSSAGAPPFNDSRTRSPALLPPSASQKPLSHTTGLASKPSRISYKLKKPRPLRATVTPPGSSPEEEAGLMMMPEEMLLFSTSSLDSVSLVKVGVGHQLFPSKTREEPELDSGLDQSCSGYHGDHRTGLRLPNDEWNGNQWRRIGQSDEPEQEASSLDLSPVDSFGSTGTFLWDEEELQPLGGAPTANASSSTSSNQQGNFLSEPDFLQEVSEDDLMLTFDDSSSHSENALLFPVSNRKWSSSLEEEFSHSPGPGGSVEGFYQQLHEEVSEVQVQLQTLQRLLQEETEEEEEELMMSELIGLDSTSSSCDWTTAQWSSEVLQLKLQLESRDQTIREQQQLINKQQIKIQEQQAVSMVTSCCCQRTKTDQTTQTPCWSQLSFLSSSFLSPPWQYRRATPFGAGLKSSRPRPLPPKQASIREEKLFFYFSDSARHMIFSPPIRQNH